MGGRVCGIMCVVTFYFGCGSGSPLNLPGVSYHQPHVKCECFLLLRCPLSFVLRQLLMKPHVSCVNGLFTLLHCLSSLQDAAEPVALGVTAAGGLIKDGVTFAIGDFMFLHREAWSNGCVKSGKAGGGNMDADEEEEEAEDGPSVPAYAAKSGRHKV